MPQPPFDVDVFIDAEGLWTTVPQDGPGTLRSVPSGQGVARRRVWRRAADADLAPWLATICQHAPTDRTTALSRLVLVTLQAAHQRSVPFPVDEQWRWRAAPDTDLSTRLHDVVQAGMAAGVATTADPLATLRQLCVDITSAHIATITADQPPLPEPAQQVKMRRWADQVVGRCGANARLVLAVNPPNDAHRSWCLQPYVIRADEPTTRLPWESAQPGLFDADEVSWEVFAHTEWSALRRAWPTTLLAPDFERLPAGPVDLTDADLLLFLDRIAVRLQEAGFDVVAPGGLLRPARVRRRMTGVSAGTGTLSVPGLGMGADVQVDGVTLTRAELAALAASKSELIAVSGRWLRVSAQDAQRLAALARRLNRPVSPADLLADEAFDGVELEAAQVLPQGLAPARHVKVPDQVRATLRPYQQAGLEWLTWLSDNQVGGVLADDMGLGKTLQVLTWVQADHPGPTLVVCPVTLVDTWARQAAQFTPGLRVQAFHGTQRTVDTTADIVITTYGLLARDDRLKEVNWHRVVLDEAQAIKNPDTHAARAARSLTAVHRLAVTGTPVENHLVDLWSLLAFAQPGLLPRRKPFTQRFGAGDETALERLRAVVGPFILRRVKTDPEILPDLPPRQTIREDCVMTREQVGAYEAVVADLMGTLEELRTTAKGAADPRQRRRATVLASISRLKQICVHPALLTESRRGLGERSGKVSRLVDLCEQILDEGQAVVVFTQFASFVPDLAAHLQERLDVPVATLTGSDSRASRSATVAAFSAADGPPILIASLKAGGTGLTLVRANHVIHLDRWWNPAVEDQASDRVWRIGQNQKVAVHVLVCPGTLEERIDEALTAKRSLAASVITSTDTAVTELTDTELTDLVALARDEVLR